MLVEFNHLNRHGKKKRKQICKVDSIEVGGDKLHTINENPHPCLLPSPLLLGPGHHTLIKQTNQCPCSLKGTTLELLIRSNTRCPCSLNSLACWLISWWC
jgi:hypothetical protein